MQTLKREIAEETGLNDIRDAQPFITVLTDIRIQNAEEDVGLVFSIYLCDINYMFSPQLSDEHITFKWPCCVNALMGIHTKIGKLCRLKI